MATVKPTPAKSQLAAVKKAEAQRAASQQAAQERAQRAAQMQRAAQLQQVAQRQAAAQRAAQPQPQLQQIAQLQAAQERAQRAAQMQPQLQQIAQLQAAQERAQRAAQMTGGSSSIPRNIVPQTIEGLGSFSGIPRDPTVLPAVFQQPGALQAAQERAQRAAGMTGGGMQTQGFGGYGFDPALVDYLNSQKQLSTRDAGISYTYDPATQTFSGGTMGGPVTKTLAEMQAEAASRPPVMSDRGMPQPIQGLGSFPGTQQQIQGLGSFPRNLPPRDIGLGTPPPGFTGPKGLPSGAPPQQVQPFRPIEGMAGNLVGGFTPPPGMFNFGQQMPAQNTGFLQGAAGPQRALDVTQGSLAYPPSFPGQQAMGLGMGAMGQGMPQQFPMQSPTQSAFQQAVQRTPSNQLNMQQAMPMQSNMGQGMGGQSNMFSNTQQAMPMQSNMGQGAMQSVGQTASNMFGGGPFASATQSGQQAQQPQQGNAPVRSGGVF